MREEHGEPDVIEVRQTFSDSLQAREWEEKVLRRMNAVKDERWLNRHNGGKEFLFIVSDEARLKMSLAKKGVKRNPHSEETKEKIRCANLGKKRSAETCNRIRMASLNQQNSFFGTEEGKTMAKERNKRLLEEGRHPSQILHLCPYCQKEYPKTAITRWHGNKCKMFFEGE